jgi:hypothetical protein
MSYNGSGTFQINTSGQPVVAGTVISSTAFNALTADLATGLSTAITKDGQTTTTARIPFAAGINSSSATDSTSTATGSIITSGGVGVAKALYVGTTANVAGAATLSSTLTYGGVTLTNAVTGTGKMVLDTSPTISGLTSSGANLSLPVIDNIKLGYTTTATAGGTTTLTAASNHQQFFTGTLAQTIVLPVTSTLALGMGYSIENNSTGTLTVQSSGLNTISTIPAGVTTQFTCILITGTTAASWDYDHIGFAAITGTGSAVLATSPTITTPTISQLSSAAATALTLQSAGTTAITVDTSQNVGIGTSTPAFNSGSGLEVQRAGVSTIRSENTANSTAIEIKAANGAVAITSTTADPILFEVSGAEKMRVINDGNLLVGTTTSGGVGISFIPGSSSSTPEAYFNKSFSGNINGVRFLHNSTYVGGITYSNTNVAYATSASDYRLKENIVNLTGALNAVISLRPVSFTWKNSQENDIGFIAHEIQSVIPNTVFGEKDEVDADGNPKYQSIFPAPAQMIANLVGAIKEQQALIQSLTTRLTALENK